MRRRSGPVDHAQHVDPAAKIEIQSRQANVAHVVRTGVVFASAFRLLAAGDWESSMSDLGSSAVKLCKQGTVHGTRRLKIDIRDMCEAGSCFEVGCVHVEACIRCARGEGTSKYREWQACLQSRQSPVDAESGEKRGSQGPGAAGLGGTKPQVRASQKWASDRDSAERGRNETRTKTGADPLAPTLLIPLPLPALALCIIILVPS